MIECGRPARSFDNARKELKNITREINNNFKSLEKEMAELVDNIEVLYKQENINRNLRTVDTTNYSMSANGMFYKKNYEQSSAAIVTGCIPIDQRVKNIVFFTEPMEKDFINIVESYPEVAQVYFNSKDSYNRIYPGVDLLSRVRYQTDITEYNFYKMADENNNPEKEMIWIKEPYVDPAGRGWLVSLIAPVYVKGQLEGVPGIDITVQDIYNDYFKNVKYDYMILSPQGVLIYAEEKIANIFSMPRFKNHKYIETVSSDIYRSEDYNVLKSKVKEVRELGKEIYNKDKNVYYFRNREKEYKILKAKVESTDWLILCIVKINGG